MSRPGGRCRDGGGGGAGRGRGRQVRPLWARLGAPGGPAPRWRPWRRAGTRVGRCSPGCRPSPPPSPCASPQDLASGVALAHVLHSIDASWFNETWLGRIRDDAEDNWRLKVSNLRKVLQSVLEYWQDVLGQAVEEQHVPDVALAAQRADPEQLGKLVRLVLGCAVSCERREEHIQRIMTLEESVQHVVMTAIQELLDKEPSETMAAETYGNFDTQSRRYYFLSEEPEEAGGAAAALPRAGAAGCGAAGGEGQPGRGEPGAAGGEGTAGGRRHRCRCCQEAAGAADAGGAAAGGELPAGEREGGAAGALQPAGAGGAGAAGAGGGAERPGRGGPSPARRDGRAEGVVGAGGAAGGGRVAAYRGRAAAAGDLRRWVRGAGGAPCRPAAPRRRAAAPAGSGPGRLRAAGGRPQAGGGAERAAGGGSAAGREMAGGVQEPAGEVRGAEQGEGAAAGGAGRPARGQRGAALRSGAAELPAPGRRGAGGGHGSGRKPGSRNPARGAEVGAGAWGGPPSLCGGGPPPRPPEPSRPPPGRRWRGCSGRTGGCRRRRRRCGCSGDQLQRRLWDNDRQRLEAPVAAELRMALGDRGDPPEELLLLKETLEELEELPEAGAELEGDEELEPLGQRVGGGGTSSVLGVGGPTLLPPPPQVMRALEPKPPGPAAAPVLRALRNQLQEKEALIRHLESDCERSRAQREREERLLVTAWYNMGLAFQQQSEGRGPQPPPRGGSVLPGPAALGHGRPPRPAPPTAAPPNR
ncbi:unnamed protein product [Bubo scandiacus]